MITFETNFQGGEDKFESVARDSGGVRVCGFSFIRHRVTLYEKW